MSYSAFEQALRHEAACVGIEAPPIGEEIFYDQSTVLWIAMGAYFAAHRAQVTVVDIAQRLRGHTVPLPCYLELRVPEVDSLFRGASA